MMMLSLCKTYWEVMLAQAVVVGAGCGCIFIPSVAILPSYFSTKRGLANGIAASGSGLGMSDSNQVMRGTSANRCRRGHLSDHIPPATATYRLWVGNSSHRLRGTICLGFTLMHHENAYKTTHSPQGIRSCRLERTAVCALDSFNTFWYDGTVSGWESLILLDC